MFSEEKHETDLSLSRGLHIVWWVICCNAVTTEVKKERKIQRQQPRKNDNSQQEGILPQA